MRGRLLLAGLGLFSSFAPLVAQFPPPAPFPQSSPLPAARSPAPYTSPLQLMRLPEPLRPQAPFAPPGLPLPPATPQPVSSSAPRSASPDGSVVLANRVETPLPQPEAKFAIDSGAVTMKKINGVWQIWSGPRPIRNLGTDETGAKDIVRLMHDQHPTEWVSIGSPRSIVEYGLIDGKPLSVAGLPRVVVPIDLRSVRIEPIKGVWCLKDNGNILFNFGLNKGDADQALAVVRKYGFNRIGMLGGDVTAPALTYFFITLEGDGAKPTPANALAIAHQEINLARTGIPVPGVGYMGEMIKLDPRKIELHRDGSDWVIASGLEVLARFGQDQNAARDAQRLIQEGQYTEFCRAGPPGLTFFLVNGQTPNRVPLFVQGRRIDPNGLKVSQQGQQWTVTERGRHLYDVSSAEEGDAVIRLMKHYQFDQMCQVGSSPRTNLTFLAKGR